MVSYDLYYLGPPHLQPSQKAWHCRLQLGYPGLYRQMMLSVTFLVLVYQFSMTRAPSCQPPSSQPGNPGLHWKNSAGCDQGFPGTSLLVYYDQAPQLPAPQPGYLGLH